MPGTHTRWYSRCPCWMVNLGQSLSHSCSLAKLIYISTLSTLDGHECSSSWPGSNQDREISPLMTLCPLVFPLVSLHFAYWTHPIDSFLSFFGIYCGMISHPSPLMKFIPIDGTRSHSDILVVERRLGSDEPSTTSLLTCRPTLHGPHSCPG
ncbi:hypothetical protein WN51_05977 [Melipona quadrifasciata]|uniref:Uncharacterized protein n=1 Tax=Melipona quadrifasciata TaxID=166423 RepID=A0A0N0BIS3_9HYME|nr:hypothetical protein WN51_05977 [Melipona quadrifasciata]